MRKRPLIIVEWNDTTGTATWDSEKAIAESEPMHCTTVGWKINSTHKKLVMAATRDTEGHFCDRSTIPRGCIKSIRTLE